MNEQAQLAADSSGAKFLIALNAIVSQDPRGPGFAGSIAFGIRESDREVWWSMSAADAVETGFSSKSREGADVSVLLGTYELRKFLETGRIPPDANTVICSGDLRLFQAMTRRYGASLSAVDIRVSGPDATMQRRNRTRRSKGKRG